MKIVDRLHPEDIKAVIRKRYRSMAAFERAEGLATGSVTEILRGRASARTQVAVERVLGIKGKGQTESIILVDSDPDAALHRLNCGRR